MRSLLLVSSLLVLAACSGTGAEAPSDAGALDALDDASGADAHASDAATITCKKPLTDDVDLDTAPIAAWCAKGNGRGARSKNACDGYYVINMGEGVDCDMQYFFDATTKKLVAETHGCNNISTVGVCVAGPSSFTPPNARCLERGFAYDYDICPKNAGARDAATD